VTIAEVIHMDRGWECAGCGVLCHPGPAVALQAGVAGRLSLELYLCPLCVERLKEELGQASRVYSELWAEEGKRIRDPFPIGL